MADIEKNLIMLNGVFLCKTMVACSVKTKKKIRLGGSSSC